MRPSSPPQSNTLWRARTWYALLVLIACVFVVRLFYLQVIGHNYYQNAALLGQLKKYEIPASRGVIEAYDGDRVIPIVLNEKRYTSFADPKDVKDPKLAASEVQKIIGGNTEEYEEKMRADTRYSVLAKKLSKEQKDKLDNLKIKGVLTREEEYRTYPQNELASQVLGFVNDEGEGKYGIEQYLDDKLRGTPGQLKAITDARGVPLAANKDNVVIEPKAGQRVVLTIDVSMQQQLEKILKAGLENAKSDSGSALIIDPNTGKVKAMANFPTFNPGEFFKVEDARAYSNAAVMEPLEVGSIMKPLTVAAALDLGVVNKDATYYDAHTIDVDGSKISNVEEDGGKGTKSIAQILQLSLNTGVSWLLMQMGGGEINQQARTRWHNYMTDHYQFGKATGIEQGNEVSGTIPDPKEGFGLNIQYANTTFGQGMSATPLQMAAALSSVLNGGTYYRPQLIDKMIDASGKEEKSAPSVVRNNVVKESVGRDIKELMEHVINKNHATYTVKLRSGFSIGGKTGTAQVPKPEGGYYDDRYNGTFMGFVGGDKAEYVIVVRVNEPTIPGYAGSKAAGPIFARITDMLVDNFGVAPKRQ